MSKTVTEILELAQTLMRQHRLPEAENVLARLVSDAPGDPAVLRNYGVLLLVTGRPHAALGPLRQAVSLRPRDIDLLYDLGETLVAIGQRDEAVTVLRKAVHQTPKFAPAQSLLGRLLAEIGDHAGGIQHLHSALRLAPRDDMARLALGHSLLAQGKHAQALPLLTALTADRPDMVEARSKLGLAHLQAGQLAAAIDIFAATLAIQPDHLDSLVNLGITRAAAGRNETAIKAAGRAIRLAPGQIAARNNLATARLALGHPQAADAQGKIMTALAPDDASGYISRSGAAFSCGHVALAIRHAERAIRLNPMDDAHRTRLASLVHMVGRHAEAAEICRFLIGQDPFASPTWSTYLYVLSYGAVESPAVYRDIARRLGQEHFGKVATRAPVLRRDRTPDRRLRVGYVSADFRGHSVAYFMASLLRHHDRSQVEVIAYSSNTQRDAMTDRLETLADRWQGPTGEDWDTLCDRVRRDEVDILVDLAGHTAGNSMPLFARRAAPIQATWLGYGASTGIPNMDYWITDRFLHPPDTVELATETIWPLSRCWLCYEPPADAPPIVPPPAAGGPLTFGSFNSAAKLTQATIILWARALRAVPDARLLLKAINLNDPNDQDGLRAAFAGQGIDPARIQFLPSTRSVNDHLALYGQIDIALDPIPYTGGTTTAEALWMGVPVLTLAGQRMVERLSTSIISATGLTDWIADTPDDFVAKAAAAAADQPRRTKLRAEQRQIVAQSSLCDAKDHAQAMENAYRDMWHRWIAR